MTKKDLLYSTGALLHTLLWPMWEKNLKHEWTYVYIYMYIYITESFLAVHLKLTQHCKSTYSSKDYKKENDLKIHPVIIIQMHLCKYVCTYVDRYLILLLQDF